ncbi:MAG: hypothetical protein KDC18_10665 [Alphaproteobacteria bacterium]|nr:hypothetical protein [Alphaproteobacteria bacterium]MCB9928008.1 hypothetical protein [Alphaproteobacteria bacterium]
MTVIRSLGLTAFLSVLRAHASASPEFIDETVGSGRAETPGSSCERWKGAVALPAGDAESVSALAYRH